MSKVEFGFGGLSLLVVGIILYMLWSNQITVWTAVLYGVIWFIGVPIAIIALVLFIVLIVAGIATVTGSW